MADETITTTSETANEGVFDPVQAINELKEKMVPREDYLKVLEERNKYCKALIDGTTEPSNAPKKAEPVDIDKLRTDLFTKDLSNLEFVEKALTLRNEIIDKEGKDIFVGSGEKLVPTEEDYRAAQRVADGLQECVTIADGNSEIFTRELMRITKDVSPMGTSGIDPRIKR